METLCLIPQAAHQPQHPAAIDNTYSKVEIGVLQLAADILRVSVEDLARLRDLLSHVDLSNLVRVNHQHPQPQHLPHAASTTAAPPQQPPQPQQQPQQPIHHQHHHHQARFDPDVLSPTHNDMPPPPAPLGMLPMDVDAVAAATPVTQSSSTGFTWAAPTAPDNFNAPTNGTWPQEYFSGSDASSDSVSFPNSRRSSVDDAAVPAVPPVIPQYPVFPPVSHDLASAIHASMNPAASAHMAMQEYPLPTNESQPQVIAMEASIETRDIARTEAPRVIQPRPSMTPQLSTTATPTGVIPQYRRFRGKKNSASGLSRTRSAFEPEQRQRTALIRKLKACIRCHLQKEGVSFNPGDLPKNLHI